MEKRIGRKIKPSKRIKRYRIILLIFLVALIVLLRVVLPIYGLYIHLPKLSYPFVAALMVVCLIPAERAGPIRIGEKTLSAPKVKFLYMIASVALMVAIPASFAYTSPISPMSAEFAPQMGFLVTYAILAVIVMGIYLPRAEKIGPLKIRIKKTIPASLVRSLYVLLTVALVAAIPASVLYAVTRPIPSFERGKVVTGMEYLITYDNPDQNFHQVTRAQTNYYGSKILEGENYAYYTITFDESPKRWIYGGFIELDVNEIAMWCGTLGSPYEGLFRKMGSHATATIPLMGKMEIATPTLITYHKPFRFTEIKVGERFTGKVSIKVITGTGYVLLELEADMVIEVEEIEPVELPFGTFDCYRIRATRKAAKLWPEAYSFIWGSEELFLTVKYEDHGTSWDGAEQWVVQRIDNCIIVRTTPVKGDVFVEGESFEGAILEKENWGTATQHGIVRPGTYKVTFGEVEGYVTPEPQTITLGEGETKLVIGVYEKKST